MELIELTVGGLVTISTREGFEVTLGLFAFLTLPDVVLALEALCAGYESQWS